jgi:hypothetical protein
MERSRLRATLCHVLLVATVYAIPALALVPQVSWEKTFFQGATVGGLGNAAAGVDAAGDVFIAGSDVRETTSCASLLKLSGSTGATIWRNDDCEGNTIYNLAVDPQGNVLLAGGVQRSNGYVHRVAKHSGSTGALIWQVVDEQRTAGTFIVTDRAGNAYVTASGTQRAVLKYSPSGARIWAAEAGFVLNAIRADSAGNLLVAGRVGDAASSTSAVTKFSSADGAPLWRQMRPEGLIELRGLAVDATDNVIAAGRIAGAVQDRYMPVTVKYGGASGNVMWQRVEPTSDGYLNAVAISEGGDVGVTGVIDGRPTDATGDAFTARYRGSDGSVQWSQRYDGGRGENDEGEGLAFDANGDIVVVATTSQSSSLYPNSDIRVLRYAGQSGATVWSYGISSAVGGTTSFDFGRDVFPVPGGVIALGIYEWTKYGAYIAKLGLGAVEPLNAQGLWWGGAAESGWGLNAVHQGETLFVTWYTYDSTGFPTWFLMSALRNTNGDVYRGDVFQATGPIFGSTPFASSLVRLTTAGSAVFQMTGPDSAFFGFVHSNGGPQISKKLSRFAYGTPPQCGLSTLPGTNYQAMWWSSPAGSEPGWGLNIAHQGNTLFVSWFTYDSNGRPVWYAGSNFEQGAQGTYSGRFHRYTGPPYLSGTWDSTRVLSTEVGSGTLRFSSPDQAVFTYDVLGVSQSKAITRYNYASPATACQSR